MPWILHNRISVAGILVALASLIACEPSSSDPYALSAESSPNQQSLTFRADDKGSSAKGPIVLELFTSQGCSSCPPADRLLRELKSQSDSSESPFPQDLIVLSEHVDYWNRLGWTDPYSSSKFSARQQSYAQLTGDQVYTPQMVIQGKYSMVGHSRSEIVPAIRRAAAMQQHKIELGFVIPPGRTNVSVEARIAGYSGPIVLFLAEDGIQNHVPRGENADRDLLHDGVVRDLKNASCAKGKCKGELDLKPEYHFQNLRIVALLQEPGGPIRGAAQVSLAGNANTE